MNDETEREPLTDFRVVKAINGGWTIMTTNGDMGMRPDVHAFTSTDDMLAALPSLIGVKSRDMVTEMAQPSRLVPRGA